MYRERLFKLVEQLRQEGFDGLADNIARIAEENSIADCQVLALLLKL